MKREWALGVVGRDGLFTRRGGEVLTANALAPAYLILWSARGTSPPDPAGRPPHVVGR